MSNECLAVILGVIFSLSYLGVFLLLNIYQQSRNAKDRVGPPLSTSDVRKSFFQK